jgi:hypothetical protein
MKKISSLIIAFLLSFCACSYETVQPKSAVTEDTSAETYISMIDDIEVTESQTTTFDIPQIDLDFLFEATDEENTYYLTNVSGHFIKITDFSVIADYADATGIPKRRIEVYFDDREYPLFIDYIDGKADLENVDLYFNPFTEDIPEIAIPLSPNESCRIVLIPPYEIKLPETAEISDKLTPPKFIYNDYGLYFDDYWNDEAWEGKTTIYRTDGKYVTTKFDMDVWHDYLDYSLDKTKAAFIQSVGYQLYYISAEDMEPIFIDYHAQYFKMALSGNGIAYTDSEMSNAYLYLWDGKEKTKITEKCYDPDVFYISPDGKGVLYKESSIGYYYYENGESTFIEKKIEPIALADNGYIYYKKDNALYVQKGGDTENRITLLESKEDLHFSYNFNANLTEMMYSSNGELYIIEDGEKITKISDTIEYGSGLHLFPDKMAQKAAFGIESFAGTLYLSNDHNLYYFDENFQLHILIENVINEETNFPLDYKLSRGGNIFTVKIYDTIYRMDINEPNKMTEYDIDENVEYFIPTEDGNGIFYFTDNQELMFMKQGEEVTLLLKDIGDLREDYFLIINNDELLFINDDKLTFADSKSAKILNDDLYFVQVNIQNGVMYLYGKHSEYHYLLTPEFDFIQIRL